MAGLYKTVFGGGVWDALFGPPDPPTVSRGVPEMGVDATNRHFKREQDNYLTQIGAMDKINRDPNAYLGYLVRSHPEYKTLEMGGMPQDPNYGDYTWYPNMLGFKSMVRRDGELNVGVDQTPQNYGSIVTHELGHVGSRNSQSDRQATLSLDTGEEEMRQRITDYLINPPGTRTHADAKWFLKEVYGLNDKQIEDWASYIEDKQNVFSRWRYEQDLKDEQLQPVSYYKD